MSLLATDPWNARDSEPNFARSDVRSKRIPQRALSQAFSRPSLGSILLFNLLAKILWNPEFLSS